VSIDYGPLTFSLRINEKWQKYGKPNPNWPEWEVYPGSPWNYGLDIDPENPSKSITVFKRSGPLPANPFKFEDAPLQLRAPARRIPEWKMDSLNVVGKLQPGPVKSDERLETVTLIPMGAARLRITSFPLIGHGHNAHQWTGE
jgi:hypothetical protein